jgi:hypothetical protein
VISPRDQGAKDRALTARGAGRRELEKPSGVSLEVGPGPRSAYDVRVQRSMLELVAAIIIRAEREVYEGVRTLLPRCAVHTRGERDYLGHPGGSSPITQCKGVGINHVAHRERLAVCGHHAGKFRARGLLGHANAWAWLVGRVQGGAAVANLQSFVEQLELGRPKTKTTKSAARVARKAKARR